MAEPEDHLGLRIRRIDILLASQMVKVSLSILDVRSTHLFRSCQDFLPGLGPIAAARDFDSERMQGIFSAMRFVDDRRGEQYRIWNRDLATGVLVVFQTRPDLKQSCGKRRVVDDIAAVTADSHAIADSEVVGTGFEQAPQETHNVFFAPDRDGRGDNYDRQGKRFEGRTPNEHEPQDKRKKHEVADLDEPPSADFGFPGLQLGNGPMHGVFDDQPASKK